MIIPAANIEQASGPKATDEITVHQAFDAMCIFLEAVWQRHGENAEDIAFLLGGTKWADGSPIDPTIWEDWLMAVRISASARTAAVKSIE
jgi:hypothetical protein